MRIAAIYSHKGGEKLIQTQYSEWLAEIVSVVESIDAEINRTKESKEKTMPGQMLFNPVTLNKGFKKRLADLGWSSKRITIETPDLGIGLSHTGFREVDFLKGDLGLEVQFGKYAFLVYDIISKMVIFHRRGLLNAGIEILPTKRMVGEMSSGIGHFEQVVADLYHRGIADLDVPVLILGIEPAYGANTATTEGVKDIQPSLL